MGEKGRSTVEANCPNCGRGFMANRGVGRPGKYCRRSCRQRAYEQRRHEGDDKWTESRIVALGRELADLEDVVDQLAEVLVELRANVDDEAFDAHEVVERMEAAFVRPSDGRTALRRTNDD